MKGQCTSVILDQDMISSWHQKLWQIEHIVEPKKHILLSLVTTSNAISFSFGICLSRIIL